MTETISRRRAPRASTWFDKWDGRCACKLCLATRKDKDKLRKERVKAQMELLRKEEGDGQEEDQL